MSFEKEKRKIFETLKNDLAEAHKQSAAAGYHGKDGPSSVMAHEAVSRYNAALRQLKEKYEIE